MSYLAGWAEEAAGDTFEQIAELVDRLARRLEDALSDVDDPSDDGVGEAQNAAVV